MPLERKPLTADRTLGTLAGGCKGQVTEERSQRGRRSPAAGLRGQPPARVLAQWAHHWASVLPQTMRPAFPYTVALCARTKYIINIHTAQGLLSTDCETTGLFSHPMGRRLRTPPSSCPHTPGRLGSTIRAYSPQNGPSGSMK